MLNSPFQTVSIIGLGYIGLPTAAMFASRKVRVIGVDVNAVAVEKINRGAIHIVEPDLDIAVHAAVTAGYLSASTTPQPADAFLIAVPTPLKEKNREPDLSCIQAACRSIAHVLKTGDLVVLESTSPVGATEQMATWLAEARPDLTFPQTHGEASDIRIAHCPERVLPGKVMQELISNDRVIGGLTPLCSERACLLYKTFVAGDCIITNARTAEMTKLTENSFRDVNIAFANELSIICDKLEIDVWELIALANRHPRVAILQPGPGVGGHCLAVDPWFIVASAPEEAPLIRTARQVNDSKPEWVANKVHAAVDAWLGDNLDKTAADVTLAIYGLTFKPDIDDLRESAALEVARRLAREHQGPLLVVEPHIAALPDDLAIGRLVDLDTAGRAEIHGMLVDHQAFKSMGRPRGRVVDARGIWRPNSCDLV